MPSAAGASVVIIVIIVSLDADQAPLLTCFSLLQIDVRGRTERCAAGVCDLVPSKSVLSPSLSLSCSLSTFFSSAVPQSVCVSLSISYALCLSPFSTLFLFVSVVFLPLSLSESCFLALLCGKLKWCEIRSYEHFEKVRVKYDGKAIPIAPSLALPRKNGFESRCL